MKTNSAGIELIKKYEQCKLTAYKCAAGVWTIGWGHTGDDVYEGRTLMQSQADELLEADLAKYEADVEELIRGVEVSSNEFSALVSLAYNVGADALRGSRLMQKLRGGSPRANVAIEFLGWNKARVDGKLTVLPGLVQRREAEAKLFVAKVLSI